MRRLDYSCRNCRRSGRREKLSLAFSSSDSDNQRIPSPGDVGVAIFFIQRITKMGTFHLWKLDVVRDFSSLRNSYSHGRSFSCSCALPSRVPWFSFENWLVFLSDSCLRIISSTLVQQRTTR